MDAAIQHTGAPAGIERMDPVRYTPYMNLLSDAFQRLLAYYGEVEKQAQTSEGESMALYVQKILATMKALRLKHAFSPAYFLRPGADLAQSGFPHYQDIIKLDSDLAARAERLPKLPELDDTREMLLDFIMRPGTNAPVRNAEIFRQLQWQFAERAYYESLDLRQQFFRFTPGKLFEADPRFFSKEKGRRAYQFSWGCYDSQRNRPCVYFMLVLQDEKEVPLDRENNPEFDRFLQSIDSIASRAPEQLLPIAVRLDESFKGLYPKALKRICMGPLVSPLLCEGEGCVYSDIAAQLLPVFEAAGLQREDFVLFFSTEMVVSKREEVPATFKSVLGFDKVRQIFEVPKTDRELLRRQASAYRTFCILPHRLRQHLTEEMRACVPEFADPELTMLAYQRTEEGVVNVG